LFSKVDVNGEHTDQVYNWLKSHSSLKGADGVVADIAWNFGKFVVDGEGNVVEYFGPKQQP
jgi:glutathione peroxidase